MNILVIGGTRFIGPPVIKRLVSAGHNLTVFNRGQTEAELPTGVKRIHGDRHQLASFAADFKRLAPDVVLDMILYTEEEASALVDVFKGVAGRVVAVSSADVYRAYGRLLGLEHGEPDPVPLGEDAPLRETFYPHRAHTQGPDDFKYFYEKILVERVVMSGEELPGTILRLPAVYGEGDPQHRLHDYLKRMDDNRPAILLGEKLARWRWTRGYVCDVATAIALAVENERAARKIYNVGEAVALTEADWVHSIGHAAVWSGDIVELPEDQLPNQETGGADYEHHLVTDTSLIRDELGYSEHFSRQEALKRTIDWERENPPSEVDPSQFDYAAEDAVLARLR